MPLRRPAFIARQASRPTGILGGIVAWFMARETRAFNQAAIGLLGIEPNDRVLEIGFGHGRTLTVAAAAAPGVTVDGIDLSESMLRTASRRCARLVRDGRVRLRQGDAAELPYPDAAFDKILAVHTLYFWREPERPLREARRVLAATGALVLGFQERTPRAVRLFPPPIYRFYPREEVVAMLRAAGFGDIIIQAPGGDDRGVLLACARP
jgi:ubiquinone/menaquinone biosynthesis C-methylase UbiE